MLPASYAFADQLLVPSSYATIQAAIDAADAGDEVVVSNGTYDENINFGGKAITVTSLNGPASTIIDGGGSGSVVTFENSEGTNSVLNGFTIQNGEAGIYCNGVSPTISNCIITNNTGATNNVTVGGINSISSSLTITNSTISNNTGWALYNYPGSGSLVMTGSLVDNNGGGVLFSGATIDVSKSIFTNNSNTGLRFSATGTTTITNSLFAKNDSQDRAGGIWVAQNNPVNIMNCTIADNSAQKFYGSGGIYVQFSSTPLTITNSILTWNMTQNSSIYNIYPNTYVSNFDISYTMLNQSLYSDYGPGNIYNNPYFVDSVNGDYHLAPNSYNIDAGTSDGAPADDLDGNSRPQNEVYDIGPYEFTCPPDGDGDGYYAAEGCGNYPIDCNDSDASIHPGKAIDCSVNGSDNDCDGQIDSDEPDCTLGCANVDPDDQGPDYSCSTGLSGICYNGTRTCSSDIWTDCIQDNQPTAEICDGLDNDCDGHRDEGLGTHDCDTGLLGECAAGIESCKYYNNVYDWVCQPITAASDETCDGKDNDCDGTIDDNLSTACITGLPGICGPGTISCIEGGTGEWGSCLQTNQAIDEICDGQDNDCDGDIDEGFDSDGDGTADCSDGCPSDPNKIAAGQCGCGAPDTDTDSDGTANCVDECPDDISKITPGICGCGVADCPQLPIIGPDGADYSWVGSSVALSDDGTIAVIGASGAKASPDFYGNEFASGRIYIYTWNGSSWNLQQNIEDPAAYSGNLFGDSVSISGDGNTILVGAHRTGWYYVGDDIRGGSATRRGCAHVYSWDGSSWVLQASFTDSAGANYDDFGSSTALSSDGNTAVIGAPGAEISGYSTDRGATYVFVRNDTTWTLQEKLHGTGTHTIGEHFASSTALSDDGNTLVVGAEKGVMDSSEGWTYYGLAYVFTRNASAWTQEAILRASDYILQEEKFGHSASISRDGNTALIGKPGYGSIGDAYIFTRTDSTWSEQQILTPSDSTNDYFGGAVSISGDADKAIIGARLSKTNDNVATGAAYVFTRNGTTWSELYKHFSEYGQTSDYYGTAVAISRKDGSTALAGASLDDVGGHLNQGAVYVIPTIIDSLNPARGASNVALNTQITISFDVSMNGATFDDTSFTLLNGGVVSGIVNYDDGSKTATITPLSLLTNSTRYIAGLTGVEDATGNVMTPFYWSFTTMFIDTDNDGLPDTIEDTNQNGIVDIGETDPNNPDTDGDGLSDGFEDANYNGLVDNNETDPRNFDSDGDGLNDGLEVNILGTNPTLADSDSNGILDGDEDSDGDGFTNTQEILCDSDPADPNSKCVTFLPFLMLLLD